MNNKKSRKVLQSKKIFFEQKPKYKYLLKMKFVFKEESVLV
jgi:hypothetical protein